MEQGAQMADYKTCAEKCRRLAKLRANTEHWEAFLEMAETWEKLGALHDMSRRLRSSGVLLQAPSAQHENLKSK
jgi:hypothetical protein